MVSRPATSPLRTPLASARRPSRSPSTRPRHFPQLPLRRLARHGLRRVGPAILSRLLHRRPRRLHIRQRRRRLRPLPDPQPRQGVHRRAKPHRTRPAHRPHLPPMPPHRGAGAERRLPRPSPGATSPAPSTSIAGWATTFDPKAGTIGLSRPAKRPPGSPNPDRLVPARIPRHEFRGPGP